MTSSVVTGVWRSHSVLDESEAESSPEAPQQFKKMRSSSSLNSLRMSLRKRLPLKSVQNIGISDNPSWESLQMNQKTNVVLRMTRNAKNSLGNVYQRFQRSRQPRRECLVMTPGTISDGEENDCAGVSQTPKRSTTTPRRTPRSSSQRTPGRTRTPDTSEAAVRMLRGRGTRRQLVRMAALKSPFASPNTNSRRKFDADLDSVSTGLQRLKRLSQAFEDVIGEDDRLQAVEHYRDVLKRGYLKSSSVSRRLTRASTQKQNISSWTGVALTSIRESL
ncbi:hypothetical protein DNTS_008890 [Danionella cerebrum]|uniref:Uncharacterized protein n=1 Tax=Danionella cerebrum TaxID=2873325 RepID=A0A553MVW1_9TELE|nr:hypothetical protein DNTS_008890 [Danionella translucida]